MMFIVHDIFNASREMNTSQNFKKNPLFMTTKTKYVIKNIAFKTCKIIIIIESNSFYDG